MFSRKLAVSVAVLALAMFVGASFLRAEDKAKDTKKKGHVGTFVSADGTSFTMKDKKGNEHKHTLADDATVTGADGKECKLSDLKEGEKIRVTTKDDDKKVATKVAVVRKKKDNDK
jgi:hypothetical protein